MRSRATCLVLFAAGMAACSGGGGSGGTGGAGGSTDPCAPTYPGTLATSTIHGTGFDQWEQDQVYACFDPAQSFGSGCGFTTVKGGAFSLTEKTCTGLSWSVTITGASQSLDCSIHSYATQVEVTPANCSCASGCDAGATADGATDR